MKKRFSLALVFSLLLLVGSFMFGQVHPANAQAGGPSIVPPEPPPSQTAPIQNNNQVQPPVRTKKNHHGNHWKDIQKKLGLTDQQVAQLKQIADQEKAQKKALRQQAQTQIKSVLTPQQYAQLEQMLKSKKHHPNKNS